MKVESWTVLTLDVVEDSELISLIRGVGIRPLAAQAGVSPSTLVRWLAGGYVVSLQIACRIFTAAIQRLSSSSMPVKGNKEIAEAQCSHGAVICNICYPYTGRPTPEILFLREWISELKSFIERNGHHAPCMGHKQDPNGDLYPCTCGLNSVLRLNTTWMSSQPSQEQSGEKESKADN